MSVPWWVTLLVCLTCEGVVGKGGKYLWGDYLAHPDTKGPDGNRYPRQMIDKLYQEGEFGGIAGRGNSRKGRTLLPTMDPSLVQQKLLQGYNRANHASRIDSGRDISPSSVSQNLLIRGVTADVKMSPIEPSSELPIDVENKNKDGCDPPTPEVPARLCPTQYNTTAPMYGVSLTSGKPVTIVQKFPDLLQQVIFEVCKSDTCDVVHGSCIQTYVPYLFLVIPLGPVTLTGQDYVLVESGCVCQPKYGRPDAQPSPIDAIKLTSTHN